MRIAKGHQSIKLATALNSSFDQSKMSTTYMTLKLKNKTAPTVREVQTNQARRLNRLKLNELDQTKQSVDRLPRALES